MARAAADTDDDSGEESVWESEWEGFSGDEDQTAKAKRPERKSATQRNKMKRRKEAERAAKHNAIMRAKEQQVQMIKALAKSVEEKERSRDAAKTMAAAITAHAAGTLDVHDGEELELRKKQFGRIPYVPNITIPMTSPLTPPASWTRPSKSSCPTNCATRCAPSSQRATCSRTASAA